VRAATGSYGCYWAVSTAMPMALAYIQRDSEGRRQKRRATEDDWTWRAETCSAHRETDVFVGTEDERRLGIEIGE
jgi:hypothetical protein